MSRIFTNVNSLQATNRLNANTSDLNQSLARLSSGLRINTGKDDPAGLIASETLRSEMRGIGQAIDNSERAGSVIATAEGALNEVSALLLDLKELVTSSANDGAIAPEELKANQLQIDSAVSSINRISNSTQFEGVKLLNGNMSFTTSGVTTSEVKDLSIDEVRFGTATAVDVTVQTDVIAETGGLWLSADTIAAAVTLEVSGTKGVEVFSFASGTGRAAIASAINQAKDVTGVSAVASGDIDGATSGLIFKSMEYGSTQFVKIEALSGTFATKQQDAATFAGSIAGVRDVGVDASVSINGTTAVADGLAIEINGPTLTFQATLDATMNVATSTSTFKVTGGGAQFQLGPNINAQQMSIVGIQGVGAHRLGTAANGHLIDVMSSGSASIVGKNFQTADKIVDDSIQQVARMRGRLGAFQKNTLDTNINSLQVTLENVTASESAIRDADFAEETAAMTRSQILVQAGTSVLSIANSSPQNVLALLG